MTVQSTKTFYLILVFCLGTILFCSCKVNISPEPPPSVMPTTVNTPTIVVPPKTITLTATSTWVAPSATPTPNVVSTDKIDLLTKLKPGNYLLYIRKNYLGI